MDVWQITVAALRRWYVFLPLLALTGYATITVGNGVRPEYEVTATAILVPGTAASAIENPYGGMGETGEALAIILNGPRAREQIREQGLDPNYEFQPRTTTRILDVTVLGETAQEGIRTGEAVLDLTREELASSQESVGIPPEAQMGLETLQAPSVAEVVSEGKLRSMAIVGILGAALSLLVAVLFDDIVGLLRRKMSRRPDRTVDAERAGSTEGESMDDSIPANAKGSVTAPDQAAEISGTESTPHDLERAGRNP